jgi:hypothetical protein
MVDITKKQLKKVLNLIDQDISTKRLYDSQWHKIVNFLYSNTGLNIARIVKGGSLGKQTYFYQSDLDVGFSTSEDYNQYEMLSYLKLKADQVFGEGVYIHQSSNAVQFDFNDICCKVDLVYLTNDEFDQEFEEVKQLKTTFHIQQNAIKIVKFGLYRFLGDNIHGYEVERACLNDDLKGLKDCVLSIIHYFNNRLNQYGYTENDVVNFLLQKSKK